METDQIVAIFFLIGFALVFGYLASRSSHNRVPLRNTSIVGRGFHILACGLMSVITPYVILSVTVFHLKLIPAILSALVFLGLGLFFLIPWAILEKPAQDAYHQQKDKGWTAQDAKSSGL